MGRTHAGTVHEELQPGKDSRWRSLWRTVSRERDLALEQGKSVRSLPHEEEGAAETCDELTVTQIPCPPAPLGVRRERNGSEVEPGKKGGVGGRSLKI